MTSKRPSKAAIAYLKEDPTRAPDFDAKYGAGTSAVHLNQTVELTEMMAEMLECQVDTNAKLDALLELNQALIAHIKAPKRVVKDAQGEITGVEVITEASK